MEPGCPEEILVYRVCILCFKVDLSHESNCPYSYIIYYIDSVIYIYIYIYINSFKSKHCAPIYRNVLLCTKRSIRLNSKIIKYII